MKYKPTLTYFFKILKNFWITSLASELEYKVNFYVEVISVLGNTLGSIFILKIFYTANNDFSGWSWDSSLMVLGVYSLLEGLTISFLQPNLSKIVKHVQNGTLDFILIKPINTQLWLSTRIITPWGIPSLLSGIILIIYGFINQSYNLDFNYLLLFFLLLISSFLILYSLWFIIATMSIWFVKVWNANEVLRSILVAGKYPVNAFPQALRTVFTFLIPIAFLTTIPVQTLLGFIDSKLILLSLLISILLFIFSRFFWNFALRFYTSASS